MLLVRGSEDLLTMGVRMCLSPGRGFKTSQSLRGASKPLKVTLNWSGAELAPWGRTGLSSKCSLFPQSGLHPFSPRHLSLRNREAVTPN